ncbi:MAG: pantoate--beta-alanine ligase [Candidatus Omnitrophica bacterium]|nr:pantoate--beta-alanine ligase [Candidatus Omnitrophota bacterium]
MKTIENISRMSTFVKMMKKEGKSISLVPTMGYLHEGHLSLVKAAKKHTDVVIMSIFINPIQFGPKEDFEKYPRDLKRDEEMAREAGVDVIFYPSLKDMYPEGYATYVTVEKLTGNLCGESRPEHFRGVATVVTKLFNIVKPEVAYFGQKDMQQAMMVKKMASDLNMGVEVKMMPVVREKDGLAMSSRNIYLSDAERRDAAVLYQSLKNAEMLVKNGERDARKVTKAVEDMIKSKQSARIEYVKLVDAGELSDVKMITGEIALAVAVFFGETRLIDNTTIMVK